MAVKPQKLEVLFEDADLIAINKPAGLAAIPGRGETDCVLERLAAQINLPCKGNSDPRLRVVHRLDKDTTGVMLFAKNIDAQRVLSHQFQNNTIIKEYLALCSGKPQTESGQIEAKLAPHPVQHDRMTVFKHGRPARTDWKIEQRFKRLILIRAYPKTGKTHQIRVHLAHIGLPLAIDPLYHPTSDGTPGGIYLSHYKRFYSPTKGEEERPLMSRLTLHAEKLTFQHPNGSTQTITAPHFKDFRATINQLGRHN